jgi:hypothetical protein
MVRGGEWLVEENGWMRRMVGRGEWFTITEWLEEGNGWWSRTVGGGNGWWRTMVGEGEWLVEDNC